MAVADVQSRIGRQLIQVATLPRLFCIFSFQRIPSSVTYNIATIAFFIMQAIQYHGRSCILHCKNSDLVSHYSYIEYVHLS